MDSYAQNPLRKFPRKFPVDGEVANLLRPCYGETHWRIQGVTWNPDPPKICKRPQIRYRLYSMQLDKITFLLILLLQNVKI